MATSLHSRSRASLVGLAVGDALGAPIEFLPEPQDYHIAQMGDKIAHFHKNYRVKKGAWTDDTEMALCVADSLLENGGYNSYDIMRKYLLWSTQGYRTVDGGPAADIGLQTARAIERFCDNPAIRADEEKEWSAGNGAIMRLAPIIIASKDLDSAIELARLSCRETHNSIAAEAVTEMFATALFFALQGKDKEYLATHFADHLTKDSYKDFYTENKYALIGRAKEKDGAILHDLGGYIVDAFAIAFWGLLNFETFEDGMLAVLRLGGDTDTNGAIYGQLAGAYYGYEAILEEWREGVYLANELIEIADELLAMEECPVIRTRFEDERNFEEVKFNERRA